MHHRPPNMSCNNRDRPRCSGSFFWMRTFQASAIYPSKTPSVCLGSLGAERGLTRRNAPPEETHRLSSIYAVYTYRADFPLAWPEPLPAVVRYFRTSHRGAVAEKTIPKEWRKAMSTEHSKKKWSADVTEHSDALDLENDV